MSLASGVSCASGAVVALDGVSGAHGLCGSLGHVPVLLSSASTVSVTDAM